MTGRPQPAEADAYYFRYIDKVAGDDPLAAMQAQFDEFVPVLNGISQEQSLYSYAPGKWSIRQVLNHITDTERAFAFRALWFSRGFESLLPGYDPDIAAVGAEADRVHWSAHVEEFRHVRLASIALFRNLPPEAWRRTGIASGKSFTVRALAFLVSGHVAHHAAILREKYLVRF
ncbi:MAG: DinB family protein [Acidobacteriota bacterium]|nr:DinB family protein [Acidobacteriota bacterium]